MEHYAGIDVSLECSSVCVVDASGKIVREGKVASEPEALIAWFGALGLRLERIGLEAGPLSQWLYAAMREAGLAVELLETRHVRDAFKAMPVKTRPQRCARHRATDAARLVPPGALQVACGAGGAGAADGAQAGAVEAVRRRDEPARHPARLRAEGRARPRRSALPAGSGAGRRPCDAGGRWPRRCWRCMRYCCASSQAGEAGAARWRATTRGCGC